MEDPSPTTTTHNSITTFTEQERYTGTNEEAAADQPGADMPFIYVTKSISSNKYP